MDEIKPIKGHLVTFLKFPSYSKGHKFYYCAYVYLPKLRANSKEFGYETFRHGKTVGIDTSHWHNFGTSEEILRKDAVKQITNIIKEYEQRRRKTDEEIREN